MDISIKKQILETVLHEYREKEEILRREQKQKKESVDHDDEVFKSNSFKKMQREHPLYAVGTSLYNEKFQSKFPQPFRKKNQFSKPIEENYDTAFKKE